MLKSTASPSPWPEAQSLQPPRFTAGDAMPAANDEVASEAGEVVKDGWTHSLSPSMERLEAAMGFAANDPRLKWRLLEGLGEGVEFLAKRVNPAVTAVDAARLPGDVPPYAKDDYPQALGGGLRLHFYARKGDTPAAAKLFRVDPDGTEHPLDDRIECLADRVPPGGKLPSDVVRFKNGFPHDLGNGLILRFYAKGEKDKDRAVAELFKLGPDGMEHKLDEAQIECLADRVPSGRLPYDVVRFKLAKTELTAALIAVGHSPAEAADKAREMQRIANLPAAALALSPIERTPSGQWLPRPMPIAGTAERKPEEPGVAMIRTQGFDPAAELSADGLWRMRADFAYNIGAPAGAAAKAAVHMEIECPPSVSV
jgi:hypothetical protein